MTHYYTYRITCTHPNSIEKYYYGFRKSDLPPKEDNYWSSSKYVKEAILKYGIKNFKKKIIKVFDNSHDAISHESLLHERLSVDKNPTFFNRCKSTKWGYRVTGLMLSGRSYEEIHGSEKAELLKAQRSASMKQWRLNNPDSIRGANNPNYGNRWTAEQKNKLAAGRQGPNHPAYGQMWINNGSISKKIYKLDDVPQDWVRGRIRTWKNQFGK